MRIMVVDDSIAARMLIKTILSEYDESVEFTEAENGLEAVELFKQFRPEITFLDLTMPVMDGYEALTRIIAEDPEATVIVLTADIQAGSLSRCMESGAYMVMKKIPQRKVVFEVLDGIIVGSGLS